MDQRFTDIREERRNVVVQRHIIRHHRVDHVKLIRSDEFPELSLLNLPFHRQEYHYRPSKNISDMKDNDTSYGGNYLTMKPGGNKQYTAPPPPPHHHHHHHQVQVRQRPSVAAQYSTAMLYTQSPPPPGNVINSDEVQVQVDHVKLIRLDEFPELYLLNLPTHRQEDHCHPSKNISNVKDNDTSYGGNNLTMNPGGNKKYSDPPPPPHHHHVQVRQRRSVAAQYSTANSISFYSSSSSGECDQFRRGRETLSWGTY